MSDPLWPTRRRLLSLLGPLTLGGLWRAQAASRSVATAKPIRACILVFYYGGPSQLDTFDMKPNAPKEVRGEFRPIASSATGVRVCEHLPRLAKVMHRCAIIRTLTHGARLHDSASIHALTGRPLEGPDRELFAPKPQTYPSYGSAVSYMRREKKSDVPFAALPFAFHNVVETPCQGGGFLGSAYDPLRIDGDPANRSYRADAMLPSADVDASRSRGRRSLLDSLERMSDPSLKGLRDKAHRLLASDAVRRALEVGSEPRGVRERYGYDDPVTNGGNGAGQGVGRLLRGQNLLLARRLIEAGVPFVNVYDFRQQGQNWDAHSQGFDQHKRFLLPIADQSLSALIEDLDRRGLLDTTLVVAMGEFGRTPKINGNAGRDHWPDCYSVLLAGGGVTGGAVYGRSDRLAAYPATDPVTPGDLAATIYWRFGIDHTAEVRDLVGQPHRLASGEPVRKLFGG